MGNAKERLTTYLAVCDGLMEADAEQTADDLIEWYNVRESDLTNDDLTLLSELNRTGNFRAWSCPTCDARVYEGTPEDWGDFQGVCQVDYTSYPFGHKDQCDHCRCYCPIGGHNDH